MIDVKHLKATFTKGLYNRQDPVWIKAFAEYNKNAEKSLLMNCFPCYLKVMHYHESTQEPTQKPTQDNDDTILQGKGS